jgi:steroid 5-alpha reductase family enzyme
MDFSVAYGVAASAAFSMMTAIWIYSLVLKDASLVDRFWGAGFVLIAWVVAWVAPSFTSAKALMLTLVTIWGLRLSLYIHLRNRRHGEDYRYAEMRRRHRKRFWWYSYISVFSLQGALMLMVAAPVIYVLSCPEANNLNIAAVTGAVFWTVGFIFEAGADWQLQSFKKNPANKGQLLKNGLWSITRHPNYFGDALQWWGLGIMAFPYGRAGLLTFIGPVVMTLFIRKVSGVDLLEKSLRHSKPGYAEYIANTPAFFPGWKFWILLLTMSALAVSVFYLTTQN